MKHSDPNLNPLFSFCNLIPSNWFHPLGLFSRHKDLDGAGCNAYFSLVMGISARPFQVFCIELQGDFLLSWSILFYLHLFELSPGCNWRRTQSTKDCFHTALISNNFWTGRTKARWKRNFFLPSWYFSSVLDNHKQEFYSKIKIISDAFLGISDLQGVCGTGHKTPLWSELVIYTGLNVHAQINN